MTIEDDIKLSWDSPLIRYPVEGREINVKASYAGGQGLEGVWVLVDQAAKELIDRDTVGDLFTATLDNDLCDGTLHGTEVICATRGTWKPAIIGVITMGGYMLMMQLKEGNE